MQIIREKMKEDAGYAWAWQCNLAMSFFDAIPETTAWDRMVCHRFANEGAARFMSLSFDVDVTKFFEYIHLVKQWKAA
jgi:hypothetical protein